MSGDPSNGEKSSGYTSLYALPTLVGREALLDEILDALTKPRPSCRVVYLLGEGGIGKTRVLEELVEQLNNMLEKPDRAYVTDDVVDLYHTVQHTRNGLADALYEAAPFLEEVRLEELRTEMTSLWVAGVAGQSAQLRSEHLKLFENILKDACQRRPTFFVLDTAERLRYQSLTSGSAMAGETADAWQWLLDILEANSNLYLVIAGRLESQPLVDDLQTRLGENQVLVKEVEPLDVSGVLAYFEEIEKLAQENGDETLLRRLRAFDEPRRREVAMWSQGVPIRLALIIDYLFMGGTPSELPKADAGDAWEKAFFERMFQHRGDMLETLLALGRLPKGADAHLLAEVMGIDPDEAHTRLKAIEPLTITKIFDVPGMGERYFLHDEMYHLLDKHYYSRPWDAQEKDLAQRRITQYYNGRLNQWRRDMQEAFRPVEAGKTTQSTEENKTKACPPGETLVELYQQRHALLTEDVYYALRRDPRRGFRRRYRYTRDADLSGDVALDYALQAELLSYFTDDASNNSQDNIASIDRTLVQGVLAMRPVVRAWVEERYNDVKKQAKALRSTDFVDDPLNLAILNAWEAYARIMAGEDLNEARRLLDEAIEKTKPYEYQALDEEITVWRAKAILALALRVRGYLRDNLGELEQAIKDYRRAVQLWREVNLQVEVATSTKDLAFNLGRMGDFANARDLASDALNLHRKLASPGPIGLSLNTLATIDIEEGHYLEAQVHAERALHLFQCISFSRGVGLAHLALSEAIRRRSAASSSITRLEWLQNLTKAKKHANEAIQHLKGMGDRWYWIRALIEKGCVVRDKVRVCRHNEAIEGCDEAQIATYCTKSKASLNEAAKMAEMHGYDNLQLDALVNLGWLGYYARDRALSDEAEKEVRDAFPHIFKNQRGDPLPPGEVSAEEWALWEQCGKLYVMKGAWSYEDFLKLKEKNKEQAEAALQQMGKLWTQALQYSAVRGEDYRNLRLGKRFIFEHTKSLNVWELKQVCQGVKMAEEEFGWSNSVMQRMMRTRSLWYCEEAAS